MNPNPYPDNPYGVALALGSQQLALCRRSDIMQERPTRAVLIARAEATRNVRNSRWFLTGFRRTALLRFSLEGWR